MICTVQCHFLRRGNNDYPGNRELLDHGQGNTTGPWFHVSRPWQIYIKYLELAADTNDNPFMHEKNFYFIILTLYIFCFAAMCPG